MHPALPFHRIPDQDHADRVILMNDLFRKQVMPAIEARKKTDGACLIIFDGTNSKDGMVCYIGSHQRQDMRNMLSAILTRWDNEAMHIERSKKGTSVNVPKGEQAYEAYRQRLLRVTPKTSVMFTILSMPWNDLGDDQREAWEQAAVAGQQE